MSVTYKSLRFAAAALVLCLTGCSRGPGQPGVSAPLEAPMVARPGTGGPAADLPSYPILLTDLPRYDAGQAVPPARSRVIGTADGDFDGPARTHSGAIAAAASPHSPAAATPITARPAGRPAAPKSTEPVDVRYVP